jgi:imidazolonepropionase-like amidohydrolase
MTIRAPLLAFAWLAFLSPVARAQTADSLPTAIAPFVAIHAPVVALTHVQLIDGTGAAPRADQTVVIEDGRITAVGSAGEIEVPAGAEVHDLSGHTVIPGIVGLHDHTFYTTRARRAQLNFSAPRMYLASGVTTIRTTGSFCTYCELNLQRQIEAGQAPGPRIYVTGPYLSGVNDGSQMAWLTSPEDARRTVAFWAEEGVSWFKAYTRISRADLGAAIDEAHERGLKVTGHLCSVSFREAVELGIDNLEHGYFTASDWTPGKEPDQCPQNMTETNAALDVESEDVRATIDAMVDGDVAMTTTVAIYELVVPRRPAELDPRIQRVLAPEAYKDYVDTRDQIAHVADSAGSVWPELFRKAQVFERAFFEAGGLLAAGVDPTGIGGALPGFGDQRNYELLIEAGFSPAEAIQVMTLNGARVLGDDDAFGSIEAGKIADLVVIAGDLVSEPALIRDVRLVFKDGLGYDSEKLLASVEGIVGIR